MSYAVIQTGGKQYKVKAGEILKVEKLHELKPSSIVNFEEVLAYGDDSKIEIGTPLISGAKVEANLIKNSKTEILNDCGHMIMFEKAFEMREKVAEFLKK